MVENKFYMSADDPPAKRRILEEGLRLFAKRGLSATSIRDIAAATGYSNPALYKHFKTKDALALMLFERSYSELMKRTTLAIKRETGFSAQFRVYVEAFVRFYDDHPDATIFTADNLAVLWPQVPETMKGRTIITLTRELLDRGKKEGLVARDADVDLQLVLVTGTLVQLARQLYLRAIEGPAAKHVEGVERLLRGALT